MDGSIDSEEKERAKRLLGAAPEIPVATLPFGVTLLSDRWRDEWVWQRAAEMVKAIEG